MRGKYAVAIREPGDPAAGSFSLINPKAPKTMPQKRAPKGALKWLHSSFRLRWLNEASQRAAGGWGAADHTQDQAHNCPRPSPRPGDNPISFCGAGSLDPGGANTRKRKFNHQTPIKPRKKQGGGRESHSSRGPAPCAHRTRLPPYFSLCCCSNRQWPPCWSLWPPCQAARFTHP